MDLWLYDAEWSSKWECKTQNENKWEKRNFVLREREREKEGEREREGQREREREREFLLLFSVMMWTVQRYNHISCPSVSRVCPSVGDFNMLQHESSPYMFTSHDTLSSTDIRGSISLCVCHIGWSAWKLTLQSFFHLDVSVTCDYNMSWQKYCYHYRFKTKFPTFDPYICNKPVILNSEFQYR